MLLHRSLWLFELYWQRYSIFMVWFQIWRILGAFTAWIRWISSCERWAYHPYFAFQGLAKYWRTRVKRNISVWLLILYVMSCKTSLNLVSRYQAPGEIDPSFKVQYEKQNTSSRNPNYRNRNKPYTSNSDQRSQPLRPQKFSQSHSQPWINIVFP